jgi:hypothetical protein
MEEEYVYPGIEHDQLFEATLMDEFSCLVIRGICNYADSHKNKSWQPGHNRLQTVGSR